MLQENAVAAMTGVPALACIKNRLYGSCSHFCSDMEENVVGAEAVAHTYASKLRDKPPW